MSYRGDFKKRGPTTTGISEVSMAAEPLTEPFVYDYHKTRKALWRKGIQEWVLTLALCGAIVGVLRLYQGSNWDQEKRRFLASGDVRRFNTLTVGLSLALGFNLASSLKSYASMIRWSLLARHFQDLETFELILGCSGQTNLIKLAWKSCPWPSSWPPVWGLGRSSSKVIFLMSLGWLAVNLLTQIAVAALGQFWPAEPSETGVVFTNGNVTVANFEKWVGGYRLFEDEIDIWQQAGSVNDWGLQSQDYQEIDWVQFDEQNATSSRQTIYHNKEDNYFEYRFDDRSETGDVSRWTNRYIRARAACQHFEVVDFYNNCTWEEEGFRDQKCVHYMNATNEEDRRVIPPNTWSPGATTYMSQFVRHEKPSTEPCGEPRCNTIDVVQVEKDWDENGGKMSGAFLRCNSTLEKVQEYPSSKPNFNGLSDDARSKIFMNDTNASLAAGAIGLTAYNTLNTSRDFGWTAVHYNTVLRWSPNVTLAEKEAEELISRFAIGAVAAFSDHGRRLTVINQNNVPVQAMTLEVAWIWILVLMLGICCIQFIALVVLLSFGNKAILRDESVWSLARLLGPVVKKVGPEGNIMRGDDFVNHPIFKGKKILYGVRERGVQGKVIELLWEHRDGPAERVAFDSGVYN